MKRIILPILLLLLSVTVACDKSEPKMQAVEREELQHMLNEIQKTVDDVECTDPDMWDFTALGSKACGGPQMYIAYPNSIDVEKFLRLVEEYTKAEQAYNEKYGIISDCRYVVAPKSVICQDGKPVLIYGDTTGIEKQD